MSSGSSDLPGLEARTIAEVRASTRFLLRAFNEKTEELKGPAGQDVKKLLRFGVDPKAAGSTAKSFFGGDSADYIAIDGTFSVDQKLDLLVFYVGAFGYSGTLRFLDDRVEVGDPKPMSQSSQAVSASIPLSEEDAATVFGQRTESGTEVETERLPNAIMHLAEYYIAVNAVSANPRLKVVLVDRTLAGDVAHLVWSTRDLVKNHLSVLEGMNTQSGKVTGLDLELARMLVPNAELKIPAPRSQLLKFAALHCLFEGEALSLQEIAERLGAGQGHVPRIRHEFRELDSEFQVFERSGTGEDAKFKLKPEVKGYWGRVVGAALEVCDRIFNPKGEHPLRMKTERGERWITADDMDTSSSSWCSS